MSNKEPNKTIKVSVYFFVDDLKAEHKGKKLAVAFNCGRVHSFQNERYNLEVVQAIPFNSFEGVSTAIRKVFRKQGVMLLDDCYTKK
jgi:hypothetical protein